MDRKNDRSATGRATAVATRRPAAALSACDDSPIRIRVRLRRCARARPAGNDLGAHHRGVVGVMLLGRELAVADEAGRRRLSPREVDVPLGPKQRSFCDRESHSSRSASAAGSSAIGFEDSPTLHQGLAFGFVGAPGLAQLVPLNLGNDSGAHHRGVVDLLGRELAVCR